VRVDLEQRVEHDPRRAADDRLERVRGRVGERDRVRERDRERGRARVRSPPHLEQRHGNELEDGGRVHVHVHLVRIRVRVRVTVRVRVRVRSGSG